MILQGYIREKTMDADVFEWSIGFRDQGVGAMHLLNAPMTAQHSAHACVLSSFQMSSLWVSACYHHYRNDFKPI